MSTRHVVFLAALAFLPACSDSTSCETRTEIVEVVWGSLAEEIEEFRLNTYKTGGWSCTSEGLRNAFGTQIGTKHTCTICD